MTIDPSTPTVVQCDTPGHWKHPHIEFGCMKIVRTFSPDPLPSQEVPRDQWATIRPGSRVRVDQRSGNVIIGIVSNIGADPGQWFTITLGDVDSGYADVNLIARVFLLDEPTPNPDAEAVEALADAICWEPREAATSLTRLRNLGFDVVRREQEETR